MQMPQGQDTVSVIMPTYNCCEYIVEAVRSVQAQSYQNWELLIVDDRSTDDTANVLLPFLRDPRIHYHCLEQRSGAAAARNRGLEHAVGQYVAFLDSDDLWTPDKLEKQLRFMKEHPSGACRFSCTGYEKMDEEGRLLGIALLPRPEADYRTLFRLGNCIGNSTVLLDRRILENVQIPVIQRRSDYALWLRLLRKGGLAYGMEDVTMRYRIRRGSVSYHKLSGIPSIWQLYRDTEKMHPLLAAWGVIAWAFVKGTGIGLRIRKTGREE